MTTSDTINVAVAISAGVSALIAALYTAVTARILRVNRQSLSAMRDQVDALTRPRVVIWPWVRLGTQLFCLSIKNTGLVSATGVRLTLDRDFFVFGDMRDDKNLRLFSAFTNSIDALAPNAEMIFYLGVSHQLFHPGGDSAPAPLTFKIRAQYIGEELPFDETTIVDLKPFLESAVPQDPVAEEVSKIAKELHQVVNQLQTLNRNTQRANSLEASSLDAPQSK